MTKEDFSKIRIPAKPPHDPYEVYVPILQKHGIKTKAEVNALRQYIAGKIDTMLEEINQQTMQDVLDGKYTDETQLPLYRNNGKVSNIPPDLMKWIGFYAWLGDYSKDLGKGHYS